MAAEVHQEGLQYLLEVSGSEEQSVPTNWYVGLATDASLAEDASLGDQTEVSGTGYARQTVATNSTDLTSATAGTNDWKLTTAEVTFTAAGAWTGAKTWFLATTVNDTGKLLASGPLSETRTLADGNTLSFQIEITLTG